MKSKSTTRSGITKKTKRLKDLPKDKQLVGLKIKIPKDKRTLTDYSDKMYIYSGWNKGLWLKKKMEDQRIFPYFFESFDDIKDLEIINEDNCIK